MATVPPFPHEPTRASRLRAGGGPTGRGLGQWEPAGPGTGGAQGGASGSISRIPPHSFEAEESLLGAMLLSRDAIAVAVEDVGGDDFYRPSHGHIFAAITSLYGRGEPADAVTVAEEMRRLGTLDPSGGISTLVSLQANTPAISSVSRYARIVQEHAQLRRLIGTAYEIAEMGYQLPGDVVATLDRAEAMVFEVAQRRSSDTTRALKELLTESLEHLEYLANRDETITGVATGYHDLDMQLFGLQPSNLVVVGARPSMGKALALDTPIPTPTGWTTMGSARLGDEVFDDRGRRCAITYVSPVQLDRKCYRIEFDDGSALVADADHQWLAHDLGAWRSARGRRQQHGALSPDRSGPPPAGDESQAAEHPRVVTTQQMLDEGLTGDGSRPNWYIASGGPLDLSEQELPIDPYVLGCWLADGVTAEGEIRTAPEDLAHFADELVLAGYHEFPCCELEPATAPIRGSGPRKMRGSFKALGGELHGAGLLGQQPKHIPALYLRASFKQRLALLQGILDAAGSADSHGGVELCLSDRNLCEQARELVCSLGHEPGQLKPEAVRSAGRACETWRFTWAPLDPVFRLERKARALAGSGSTRSSAGSGRRAIKSIVLVDSVPVRCITVDSANHLYLAGESMIPTHNTAFVLGMAAHAARGGVPVLFFSLEMSHLELAQRVLCAEARVDANRLRNGKLADSDWPKISGAIGRIGTAPLYIDDNPNVTVMDIRAKARRMKSTEGGLGLVVVDYLQLMTGRSSAESRQVEISEISRGLKILARELSIPVVAASQLSRNLEARADKRPMLADLRESGAIEQDSDIVMFIYRDEIYNSESSDRGTAEILVAKHRNGPTGVSKLSFVSNYARFGDLARM
jgi:replicative DNA helicase